MVSFPRIPAVLVQVNLVMSGHVHTYERFRGVSLAGKVQITRYLLAGIAQTYFSNSSTDGRTVDTPHPITILRDDSATANPNDRIPTTLTHSATTVLRYTSHSATAARTMIW